MKRKRERTFLPQEMTHSTIHWSRMLTIEGCPTRSRMVPIQKHQFVPMLLIVTILITLLINVPQPVDSSVARRPKGVKIEQKFYDHVNANILSTAMLASAGAFNKHSVLSHTAVNRKLQPLSKHFSLKFHSFYTVFTQFFHSFSTVFPQFFSSSKFF